MVCGCRLLLWSLIVGFITPAECELYPFCQEGGEPRSIPAARLRLLRFTLDLVVTLQVTPTQRTTGAGSSDQDLGLLFSGAMLIANSD